MSPWGSALGAVTLMGFKALHSLKGGRGEEAEKYYRVLDKAQKMPETCWKDFSILQKSATVNFMPCLQKDKDERLMHQSM